MSIMEWVHFYGPNMGGIYEKYVERGGQPVFCPETPNAFVKLLDELLYIAGSSDYIRDMHISEKLTSLLTLLMAESWHPENNFYINKFYLARIFKEQFGVTINSYLAQIRITHAKQLLRFSDLTVEQIGQTCGIEEPAYFARVFKKVEGTTPGEYRRMW